MKLTIQFLLVLTMVIFFSTCEYDEEETITTTSETSSGYRLASMNVTGTVDTSESQTFEYNSNGDLDTIITKDENGDTVEHAEYDYSSDGNLLKSIITQGNVTLITTITYEQGYKTKATVVDQNEVLQNTINYTYDANYRLVKKEVCNASGAVQGSITYTYEDEVLSDFSAVYLEYLLQSQ